MAAKFSQAAKIGVFALATAGAGFLVFRTIHKDTGKGGGYVVHASTTPAASQSNRASPSPASPSAP
jgi:hypothetical protein